MKPLLAFFCLAALAFGQSAANSAGDDAPVSLGDVAKQARSAKAPSGAKVLTNEDMPTSGGVNVVGAAPKLSAGKNRYQPDVVRDHDALNAQWQNALAQQKNRIADLERQLENAKANLARATTHYYVVYGDTHYDQYKAQADLAQQQLDNARKDLSDMQDQAHRAGVDKAYD